MKGCQPVLGCELGRKKEGDGKIEGTHPRSILALKGSGSQSHPCSPHPREVLGCSSRKGHGELQPLRFSPACPETNSCSRTRRGKCSGRRPPGLGAPLSPGRRARAQAFTRFIFPSLGAGRRGQRSAPPSLLLHRPVFREVLNSFIRSFPGRPKKIDSEPGVVLLHSTGEFTARAECWG